MPALPAVGALVRRVVAGGTPVRMALKLTVVLLLVLAGAGPGRAAVASGAAPARAAALQDDGGDDEQDDAETSDEAGSEPEDDALTDAEIDVSALNVRIDVGACAAPDEHVAAFPLPEATAVGAGEDEEAFVSEAEVAAPLADLLGSPHVLTIDLDDAGLTVPIACANITGTPAAGALIVGLEASESGDLAGVVVLREAANGAATAVATYVLLGPDADGAPDTEADNDDDTGDGESGV